MKVRKLFQVVCVAAKINCTKAIKQIRFILFILGFTGFVDLPAAFSQLPDPEILTRFKPVGFRGKLPQTYTIINFLERGGKPDGISPNDSVFKAIYAGITHDSVQIFFPPGTYFFRKQIAILRPLVLKGASADSTILLFREDTARNLIAVRGNTGSPTNTSIIGNISKNSKMVQLANTAGYAKGHFVEIQENDSSLVVSNWGIRRTGQINKIDSVGGNTLFMEAPFRRAYTAAKSPKMKRLRPVQNVGIESLKIIRLDSTTQQTSNIEFYYAANCWVKCIESQKCNFAHISAVYATNVEVSGSYFSGGFGYGGGGRAYGVMVQSTSGQCLITKNIFKKLRHSMILQSGANGNVFAYNYSRDPFWSELLIPSNYAGDLVLHGNYPYSNLFEGNTVANIVLDNSHGINGPENIFFRNRAELYGVLMSSDYPSNGQVFIGNEVPNMSSGKGNFSIYGINHSLFGNNIKGTILPAGSTSLDIGSLYLDQGPSYYSNASAWPPIGIPNVMGANKIESENRFNLGLMNGCKLETPVSLTSEISSSFKFYPNPTSGSVSIASFLSDFRIQISDVNGKIVLTDNVLANEEISMTTLPNGIYCVKLFSKGKVFTGRISKI